MALGILFVFLTPGYVPELNSFLFGNVAFTVTPADNAALLILLAALAAFPDALPEAHRRRQLRRGLRADARAPGGLRQHGHDPLHGTGHSPLHTYDGHNAPHVSFLSLPQMAAETLTRRYTPLMLLSFLFALAGGLGGLAAAMARFSPRLGGDSHHPHGPLPPRRPRRRDPLRIQGHM